MLNDNLPALALFAFVTSVTPGPNNLMLLASGANFGFRASIPHLLGISSGVLILLVSVGLGLAELFSLWPWAEVAMKWIGAGYMLYLAWRIASASPPNGSAARAARPMRYIGAIAFQWVNPKLWLMALSVFSVYVPSSGGFALVLGGGGGGAVQSDQSTDHQPLGAGRRQAASFVDRTTACQGVQLEYGGDVARHAVADAAVSGEARIQSLSVTP